MAQPRKRDVGIDMLLSPTAPAVRGKMKERYSDFHVQEIQLGGEVLRLTGSKEEQQLPAAAASVAAAEKAAVRAMESGAVDESKAAALLEAVGGGEAGEAVVAQLREMVNKPQSGNGAVVSVTVADDKAARTKVHTAVRAFCPQLESAAKDGTTITVVLGSGRQQQQKRRRPTRDWDAMGGEFLHLTVRKENIDTATIMRQMEKATGLHSKHIAVAGTKDKRGVTTQRMSIRSGLPDKIIRNMSRNRMVRLGQFTYSRSPLFLGALKGNRFSIVLREAEGTDGLDAACKALSENGFINYFGEQRFGNSSVGTHHIGIAILQKDFKKAVDLLLGPRSDDDSDKWITPRKAWAEGKSPAVVLTLLPRYGASNEAAVLNHLIRKGEDKGVDKYGNAIRALPRNMKTMFPRAVQSLIFNQAATARMKLAGCNKVLAGDLIMLPEENPVEEKTTTTVTPFERPPPVKPTIVIVAEGEEDKYDVKDVVLPVPGSTTEFYPKWKGHETLYEDLFAAIGVDLSTLKDGVIAEFGVEGAYRHVIVKPGNMEWRVIPFLQPTEDVDVEADVTPELLAAEKARAEKAQAEETEGGPAVLIKFSLPSSVYATMLIRELCKDDGAAADEDEDQE